MRIYVRKTCNLLIFSICCGESNKAPRICLGALNLFILRREQDSNLRIGFAGYTLSRRASSTTRAPLLMLTLKTTAKVQK